MTPLILGVFVFILGSLVAASSPIVVLRVVLQFMFFKPDIHRGATALPGDVFFSIARAECWFRF